MTKAEKLLRKLIAEAVMSSLNEAPGDVDDDDPAVGTGKGKGKESATMRDLRAREEAYQQYLADNPGAIEAGREASALPRTIVVPRPRTERVYMNARDAKNSGLIVGQTPYTSITHDHLEGIGAEPSYAAGNDAVNAYRDMLTHHNDPGIVLKEYLYKDVSLETQVPQTVPSYIVHRMVLTPAVMESLQTKYGNRAGARPNPTPAIASDAAEELASRLIREYSRLARLPEDKVAEEDYLEAADRVLSMTESESGYDEVMAALKSVGSAMVPGVPRGDRVIVKERIRTQAISLRPFMKKAEDANRKIRRLGVASMRELSAGKQRVVDPKTGRRSEVTYIEGMKDRDVTGSVIIPRSLLDTASEDDSKLSELEDGVFKHMGLTRFKLTQAEGYYNVARASYILSLRERVEAYYNNSRDTRDNQIVERLSPVFDLFLTLCEKLSS
jgi:hypothetical protein